MQILGGEGLLARHLARRTCLGGRPIEIDRPLAAPALEHDHDHGRLRRSETAPAHLAPVSRHGAARLGVPQGQARAAAANLAGRLHHDAPDRVARGVVDEVGAIDRPPERAVARVDRRAQPAVADERALAPACWEAAPDEVAPRQERRPVHVHGSWGIRLQRQHRREGPCRDHGKIVATTAVVHSP